MSMKKNYTLGLVKSLFVAILAACSMPAMAETFEYDFSSSIPGRTLLITRANSSDIFL